MIRYNMVYLHASIYTSHCALMLKTKKEKNNKKTRKIIRSHETVTVRIQVVKKSLCDWQRTSQASAV